MSKLTDSLLLQIQATGLPLPEQEYRFASPRRWRFDMAWPEQRLAVEVEGGTWIAGRHSRPAGFSADCDKYNAAVLHDWRVLKFTNHHVQDGRAIDTITAALN